MKKQKLEQKIVWAKIIQMSRIKYKASKKYIKHKTKSHANNTQLLRILGRPIDRVVYFRFLHTMNISISSYNRNSFQVLWYYYFTTNLDYRLQQLTRQKNKIIILVWLF